MKATVLHMLSRVFLPISFAVLVCWCRYLFWLFSLCPCQFNLCFLFCLVCWFASAVDSRSTVHFFKSLQGSGFGLAQEGSGEGGHAEGGGHGGEGLGHGGGALGGHGQGPGMVSTLAQSMAPSRPRMTTSFRTPEAATEETTEPTRSWPRCWDPSKQTSRSI